MLPKRPPPNAPCNTPEPYPEHMKKLAALAALPLLALAACSSGSGDATKTVTVSATPSSTTATLSDTPLNNMRKELDALGIPCLDDADWTPATNGEYEGADAAGICGENRAIITTHAGNDGGGPNFLALRRKMRDIAAGGGDATSIVKADGWSVLTDPTTAQKLADAHTGAEKFDS